MLHAGGPVMIGIYYPAGGKQSYRGPDVLYTDAHQCIILHITRYLSVHTDALRYFLLTFTKIPAQIRLKKNHIAVNQSAEAELAVQLVHF